jgi:hypothetical protein
VWLYERSMSRRGDGVLCRSSSSDFRNLDCFAAVPVPLGTVITWTASASGQNTSEQSISEQNGGTPTYRSRGRLAGGDFHTIVDYGPNSSLNWTTIQREGTYEIEVSAMSAN